MIGIDKKFKTVNEYAKINGITVQAVYYRIKMGLIEYVKIGSMYLVKDR